LDYSAIVVNDVSMKFHLAENQATSIKEYTTRLLKGDIRYRDFWALRNVSFEVKRGEVLGIIGSNGSGKSTLLKIIAGIMRPSEGCVENCGTVAPMLELGSGFELEMTGRENIYLNGAILGYSEELIDAHFDEIVDFSGLQQFIDVPIRGYSSGMMARLAFSVATAIRPEILIVDEILAVGDDVFQTKSRTKMMELMNGGSTVLFVSHDMDQIREICHRVLWLDNGEARMIGSVETVCGAYENRNNTNWSGIDYEKDGHYSASDHTFVILAYEESPYLEECIRSIMAQSEKGEMIICTSTLNDHIVGLAEKYGIPIRINEESTGIGSDWNFAYNQAETRLVTLAHQDDIYERKFLEKTLEGINNADTPLISFTDYYEIQRKRIATHRTFVNLRIKKRLLIPLRSKKLRSVKWMKRLLLSFANPICCPSVTCVRDNLPHKLFDEELFGSIDWAAWELLSKREGDFVYIPQTLVGHRMYMESSTMKLIRNGQRKKEDYEVLKRFWPEPIAKAINVVYSNSQKSRNE